MARWCYRCTRDHNFHSDDGPQNDPCMVQMSMYIGQRNGALISSPRTIQLSSGPLEVDDWQCVEFARCACDNGPDDPGVIPPPPPDPNQAALFDASRLMPGVWRDVVLDTFAAQEVKS